MSNPDQELTEETNETAETSEEKQEEQKVELPSVEVGDVFYRFNTQKQEMEEFTVAFVHDSGSIVLESDEVLQGIVFSDNQDQIKDFTKNFKKEKQEIIDTATSAINKKIADLEELKAKFK